ncbi:uncharacterized protein LOC132262528 [Phlebotomus argentipes]|uniref:uncharacterized protein LOC132262528 n=1 Tax=Phlebotomus argentipes TaxID=94469 RepID=UPI0028932B30|nr:uncharacterized protein LOC132262528 [Phlebotomus argentipes]
MPLLVAQRSSHRVALDHSSAPATDQPLDFTMSKFKTSTRHQLYRQYYGADDSPPPYKHEELENSDSEMREKPCGKLWLDNVSEMQWRHQLAAAAVAAASMPQSSVPSNPITTASTATSSHSTIQQSITNSNIPVRELMAQHEAAKRALAAVATSAPSSSSSSPTAATASPGRERSFVTHLMPPRLDGAPREKCLNNNERERDLRCDRDGSQPKPKSLGAIRLGGRRSTVSCHCRGVQDTTAANHTEFTASSLACRAETI